MRSTIATFALLTGLLSLTSVSTFFAGPAAAQQPQRPPNLQPLPEPPPPPKGYELDGTFEPERATVKRGSDTVEEYRVGGKLYMMKVMPQGGVPYYLVDLHGDGNFSQRSERDPGIRPPMWVIHSF